MPIRTNALERLVLIRLNSLPALLLDYFSTLGFRAAVAAIRLGIFDALESGPATSQELADRLGTDPKGTHSLLEAMTALGYLRRRGDRFENAATAQRWLTEARDPDFVEATRFFESNAFDIWADLEQTVRTGRPARPFYDWLEEAPERSAAFQAWTRWVARGAAPEIARRAPPPPGARRLLDVGGGHGLYAAAYCRAYDGLEGVVFDLPTALRSAEPLTTDPELSGRVQLQAGDFLNDDLGGGFDVALALNIVHGLDEDDNRRLVARLAEALEPGGLLVVAEQFAGRAPGPAIRAVRSLLDLNYHLALRGTTYRYEQVAGWLVDAGLSVPRRINLRSTPGMDLAVATRGGT